MYFLWTDIISSSILSSWKIAYAKIYLSLISSWAMSRSCRDKLSFLRAAISSFSDVRYEFYLASIISLNVEIIRHSKSKLPDGFSMEPRNLLPAYVVEVKASCSTNASVVLINLTQLMSTCNWDLMFKLRSKFYWILWFCSVPSMLILKSYKRSSFGIGTFREILASRVLSMNP